MQNLKNSMRPHRAPAKFSGANSRFLADRRTKISPPAMGAGRAYAELRRKKKWLRAAALALAAILFAGSVQPSAVRADYRYDNFGNAIPSQYSYVAETDYNGLQLGIGAFSSPTDLFVAEDEKIYIVDAGNSRIVILTAEFEVERVIESFLLNGQEVSIKGVTGIFVHTDGLMYLADKDGGRILVSDTDGNIVREVTRPASALLTESSTTTFLPRKVLVDSRNIIYMLSENSTQGAYMIDANGEFLGFYGRNEVQLTWQRLYEVFKRRFASEEQRAKMQNFIPVEFSNFDIDKDGFIYTVTAYSESPQTDEMVKKLNPLGGNIYTMQFMNFGDMPDTSGGTLVYNTSYTDIAVDEDGFAFALDAYSGRVFWFDDVGIQQAIFGGSGAYLGAFTQAVAVDTLGDAVLVLDGTRGSITVFEPTYFGEIVKQAFLLFNSGFYAESKELFEEIVRMDANYDWAYVGLGRAYYEEDDWETAKFYFEHSGISTSWYSLVKEEIRNQNMKEHFTGIFFGIIAVCAVLIIGGKLLAAVLAEKRKHSAN